LDLEAIYIKALYGGSEREKQKKTQESNKISGYVKRRTEGCKKRYLTE
jgi:hypothetical protein